MSCRRFAALASLATIVILASACTTPPARPTEADGTYCHRIGKSYRQKLTCTALPVPTGAVETDAKRFDSTADAGTLYIVRRRWGDTANRVPVLIDDRPAVLTIPDSMARVRLRPGEHQVVIEWEGSRHVMSVKARAGEVMFIEVVGSVWSWGSTYRWAEPDADGARRRALRSKLVADINLGP